MQAAMDPSVSPRLGAEQTAPRGVYAPPGPTDVRGPCPMLNSLANHGYLPRDGRRVHADELYRALRDVVGVSPALAASFGYPIFLEHTLPSQAHPHGGRLGGVDEEAVLVRGAGVSSPAEAPPKPRSGWASVWYYLRHPVKLVFRFGMRQPGQHDDGDGNDIGHTNGGTRGKKGKRCLDLDQLALPGVIEHDISLTRRDWAEGDNIHPQPDLIEALLASSSDGGVTLSARDLAGFRRRRIAMQREANPGLRYRELEHFFACCEIALLLGVLGDGERVRCDYVKAFFAEERLPVREGWMRRPWWRRLGLFRVVWTALKVRSMVGVKV